MIHITAITATCFGTSIVPSSGSIRELLLIFSIFKIVRDIIRLTGNHRVLDPKNNDSQSRFLVQLISHNTVHGICNIKKPISVPNFERSPHCLPKKSVMQLALLPGRM
jgi:hypothetical protein